jgi:RNA polymerase sigma-70 factor (ECF subfamily)
VILTTHPVTLEKHPSSLSYRTTEQEDRALLDAVARREQDAFEHLYEKYQTMVYHLAYRILNNRESAEEVVYEVFWQVWREADRYDAQRGSMGAWLAILTRSRAIDALRARKGNPSTEDDLTERIIATDPANDPEEITSLDQRALLVRRALDSLSSAQRTALELSFFSGFSHAEIAERLGEPLGTVKTRIRSAMLTLRAQLRPLLRGDR